MDRLVVDVLDDLVLDVIAYRKTHPLLGGREAGETGDTDDTPTHTRVIECSESLCRMSCCPSGVSAPRTIRRAARLARFMQGGKQCS